MSDTQLGQAAGSIRIVWENAGSSSVGVVMAVDVQAPASGSAASGLNVPSSPALAWRSDWSAVASTVCGVAFAFTIHLPQAKSQTVRSVGRRSGADAVSAAGFRYGQIGRGAGGRGIRQVQPLVAGERVRGWQRFGSDVHRGAELGRGVVVDDAIVVKTAVLRVDDRLPWFSFRMRATHWPGRLTTLW